MLGLVLFSGVLTACDRLDTPTPIADLVAPADPSPKQNTPESQDSTPLVEQTVLISGVIVRRVPLVNGAVYLLQDETSAIWVRTDHLPEETAQTMLVSGVLKSSGLETSTASEVQDRYVLENTRRPVESTP
ncbi:MAG: hypothetical protein EAZ61_13400 [Oscillatoriales cyanobacterium]|nr:MAG: hypothetical protein EAZ61_13400 [Oscillatoriales cyanobacterium]